jgi:hypothetical protein
MAAALFITSSSEMPNGLLSWSLFSASACACSWAASVAFSASTNAIFSNSSFAGGHRLESSSALAGVRRDFADGARPTLTALLRGLLVEVFFAAVLALLLLLFDDPLFVGPDTDFDFCLFLVGCFLVKPETAPLRVFPIFSNSSFAGGHRLESSSALAGVRRDFADGARPTLTALL